jgi:hypothetical protein
MMKVSNFRNHVCIKRFNFDLVGVEIVCCDSPDSPYHIPSSNWLAAVEAVANCGRQAPQEQVSFY